MPEFCGCGHPSHDHLFVSGACGSCACNGFRKAGAFRDALQTADDVGGDLEFLSGDVGGINLTVRIEVNNNFEPTVVVETNGTGRFWIDLDGARVYSGGNVGAHGELLKAVRDVLEMVLKNPLGLEQGLLSVWATMALDDAGLLRAPTSEADGNA